MTDLAHREAQSREPRFLRERFGKLLLHGGEFPLGGADLVAAGGRRNHPGRVLGALGEADDVPGELGHRFDQESVEREIDECRGDDRNQNGQSENVEAVADHGGLQRRFAHDHLDQLALMEAGVADHPDHPVIGHHVDHERVGDQLEPRGVAQVVRRIDLGRHVHLDDQRARGVALDGDGLHLGPLEELVAQHRGQLGVGRGLGREGGDLRRRKPLHQPLPAEIGHRGHEHEHFGQHDEENGEQKQLGRQSRHEAEHRLLLRLYVWGLVFHRDTRN